MVLNVLNIVQNNKFDSLKLVVVIILVPRVLPLYSSLPGSLFALSSADWLKRYREQSKK